MGPRGGGDMTSTVRQLLRRANPTTVSVREFHAADENPSHAPAAIEHELATFNDREAAVNSAHWREIENHYLKNA